MPTSSPVRPRPGTGRRSVSHDQALINASFPAPAGPRRAIASSTRRRCSTKSGSASTVENGRSRPPATYRPARAQHPPSPVLSRHRPNTRDRGHAREIENSRPAWQSSTHTGSVRSPQKPKSADSANPSNRAAAMQNPILAAEKVVLDVTVMERSGGGRAGRNGIPNPPDLRQPIATRRAPHPDLVAHVQEGTKGHDHRRPTIHWLPIAKVSGEAPPRRRGPGPGEILPQPRTSTTSPELPLRRRGRPSAGRLAPAKGLERRSASASAPAKPAHDGVNFVDRTSSSAPWIATSMATATPNPTAEIFGSGTKSPHLSVVDQYARSQDPRSRHCKCMFWTQPVTGLCADCTAASLGRRVIIAAPRVGVRFRYPTPNQAGERGARENRPHHPGGRARRPAPRRGLEAPPTGPPARG